MDNSKPKFEFDEQIAAGFLSNKRSAGGLQTFLGIRITAVGPGTMTGELDVRPELMTPIGNMHGGVLSAFCDHMLGCVCYPVMKKGQWAATTEFKINLSRTQAVVRIDIFNDDRRAAIAQGTVTIRDPR